MSTQAIPQSRLCGDSSAVRPWHQYMESHRLVSIAQANTTMSQRWATSGCFLAIGDCEAHLAEAKLKLCEYTPKIAKS